MSEVIPNLEVIGRQIEQLAGSIAEEIGGRAGEASEELTATLRSARERLQQIDHDLQRVAKASARNPNRYLQSYPWRAMALAAAAAFVIGVLLTVGGAKNGESSPAD